MCDVHWGVSRCVTKFGRGGGKNWSKIAWHTLWTSLANKLVPAISLLWALQKSGVYDYDYEGRIERSFAG